jgi:tRNA A-37 threonylcarbamoyl transferase component Bud32
MSRLAADSRSAWGEGVEPSRSHVPNDASANSVLLIDVVQAVLGRCGGRLWTVQPSEAWCFVSPPVNARRQHGWKLHVSATPLSAPIVLARAAEVLVRRRCSFKFGTDLRRVAELVDVWYDRGGGGKFITVYPSDDEQFRMLADELHRATRGLAGPRILSDKQLRRGSLVHYRYGEFSGDRTFTDDGVFESRMVGPDGTAFKDQRKAWFTPPAWASSPFPQESTMADAPPDSMLLASRFRVHKAIRHANKGGVFRAVDEHDGTDVIVKQARAHVGARLDGTDVRDRLRAEARMLDVLSPLGVAPAKVALFEEQEDLFLVEEQIPGKPLHEWAAERAREGGLDVVAAVAIARRLVAVTLSVHQTGHVICDLKPQNLMVTPFEEVRLIDVEYIRPQGQESLLGFTQGFAAPEVHRTTTQAQVPETYSDCFSLGTTLFQMLTMLLPEWISGRAGVRRSDVDLEQLLLWIGESHPILLQFTDLIVGLTKTSPDQRWSLAQAEEFLGRTGQAVVSVPVSRVVGALASPGSLDRLLSDGLSHLQRTMTPKGVTLWPSRARDTDPCNTWTGAAGVLATITRAARVLDDDSLHETVGQAAAWIGERIFAVPRLLPGLCVGRAGTAWALYDAAGLLCDEKLALRALELARKLPTQGNSYDVAQGLAGAGMAHLHLWQSTGDTEILNRVVACADAVLLAAHRTGDDWAWPVSADIDSIHAGSNRYGFAHGVAGAGAFLLATAQTVRDHDDDPDSQKRFFDAAIGAGATLARAARIDDGRASWPTDVGGEQASSDLWCKGSAGVGGFLIRLWAATGEQHLAELAELAANNVVHNPWRFTADACCGLAGGGHFLLDMAEFTGQKRYQDHAVDLAGVIHAQHTEEKDLQLIADAARGASYGEGTAGILDFLLRVRHGGRHPWMPDQPYPLAGGHKPAAPEKQTCFSARR